MITFRGIRLFVILAGASFFLIAGTPVQASEKNKPGITVSLLGPQDRRSEDEWEKLLSKAVTNFDFIADTWTGTLPQTKFRPVPGRPNWKPPSKDIVIEFGSPSDGNFVVKYLAGGEVLTETKIVDGLAELPVLEFSFPTNTRMVDGREVTMHLRLVCLEGELIGEVATEFPTPNNTTVKRFQRVEFSKQSSS